MTLSGGMSNGFAASSITGFWRPLHDLASPDVVLGVNP